MPSEDYIIQQGDCVLSVSAATGRYWRSVWNHPDNEDLKSKRKNPGVLLPGDVLVLPELEKREESAPTEQKHKYRVKGRLVELRVRVWNIDGPRKNEAFHVEIEGKVLKGESAKTDDDGLAICRVPAQTTFAVLVVGKDKDRYELHVGRMDPIDEVTGVHGRLENMGYETGGVETAFDDQSRIASAEFMEDEDKEAAPAKHDDPGLQETLLKVYTV